MTDSLFGNVKMVELCEILQKSFGLIQKLHNAKPFGTLTWLIRHLCEHIKLQCVNIQKFCIK